MTEQQTQPPNSLRTILFDDNTSDEEDAIMQRPKAKAKRIPAFQHIRYCITVWERDLIDALPLDLFRCISVGEETCPNTLRVHYHVACIFKEKTNFSTLKTIFGEQCHIEIMRGSWEQARKYALKDGKVILDINPKSNAGLSNDDKRAFFQAILENPTMDTAIELCRQNPLLVDRLERAAFLINHIGLTPKDSKPNLRVIYLFGPPGCGKSSLARERFLVDHNVFDMCTFHNGFLVGYRGAKAVLFDDFSPRKNDITPEVLFRLLDPWHSNVSVKGGCRHWAAELIIFTRVESLNDFPLAFNWQPREVNQFSRRITYYARCFKNVDPLHNVNYGHVVEPLPNLIDHNMI